MEVECRHLSIRLSLGEDLLPSNKNSITNTTIANIDYSMQEHDMYSTVEKCTDGTQSPRSASFVVAMSCCIEFQNLFIGVLQFTVITTFSKQLILCTNSRGLCGCQR